MSRVAYVAHSYHRPPLAAHIAHRIGATVLYTPLQLSLHALHGFLQSLDLMVYQIADSTEPTHCLPMRQPLDVCHRVQEQACTTAHDIVGSVNLT